MKIINENEMINLINNAIDDIKNKNHSYGIVCDRATCFFRSGKISTDYVENAIAIAKGYVIPNSLQGNMASVDIYIYDYNKSCPLVLWVQVSSVFSGNRYSNGYAIPKQTNELEYTYFN